VVVAALEAAIGHPDMAELFKATNGARTIAVLESPVHGGLGRTGLMMFMKLDHGAILRKETGLDTPKIVRFLIGNPLIMKEMAKHIPGRRGFVIRQDGGYSGPLRKPGRSQCRAGTGFRKSRTFYVSARFEEQLPLAVETWARMFQDG
jgi:hypothetical protein